MHPIDNVHNKVAAGFVLNLYGEWVSCNNALAAKQQLLQHVFAGEVEVNGQWIPIKQAVGPATAISVSTSEQKEYARTYNETYAQSNEPVLHKGYVKPENQQNANLSTPTENYTVPSHEIVLKRTIQLNADTVLSISETDIMMNKIVVFAIDGYLDQSNSSIVADELVTRIQADVRFLICDLSRSILISSAGWGMLAAVKGQLSKVHGDLFVASMPPEIEESFRLLQFGEVLKKCYTVNDCLIRLKTIIQRSMIESATSYVPGEHLTAPSGAPLSSEMPLQEKVKAIIAQYGPVSIFEMSKTLTEKEFGKEKIGLLKLYSILKEMNLDTKAKQLRFYRSC
jgi:anti-anti-sigma regulatory factor